MEGDDGWLKGRLNSWDEMCTNENARLRMNNIFCTLLVTGISLLMLVANLARGNVWMGSFLGLLAIAYGGMSFFQLTRPKYQRWATWAFGLMAMAMSAVLIWVGSSDGLGFIWVYIVPHVAVMVAPRVDGLVYNGMLLAMLLFLLHGPVKGYMQHTYTSLFGILYPVSMLCVMGCIYLAEMVRSRTQRRLQETAQRLESFAFTDPLTGAYNRHALVSHFGRVEAADGHGLTFAIFDLDFFKAVNDAHGHAVGDRVLQHVVALARATAPHNATLYRWGGEEFLLILKTCDAAEAGQVLEAVRKTLEETPLLTEAGPVHVTLSIGAVCAAEGDTIDRCISRADECLYRAKGGGRNRVVLEE